MPDVQLELEIQAPVARIWAAVVDIERYPESMVNVLDARILEWEGPAQRRSSWSVRLKGSILKWEERESIDAGALTMSFVQVAGDMEVFEGAWVVTPLGPESAAVRFQVTFEIGIPLLADMLNPVAQRALRDNARDMLAGLQSATLRPASA